MGSCSLQTSSVAGPVQRAAAQLDEYFAGTRTQFDLPLAPEGDTMRQRVWEERWAIPYGKAISYAELAGRPAAIRAAAAACARNAAALFVPCHRVVGTDGTLRRLPLGAGRENVAAAARERPGIVTGITVRRRTSPVRG